MEYLLIENRKIVHLHTTWRQRFIQSELDDLEVKFIVPPVEQGYIKINDNFEIIPITSADKPDFDILFEELSGPYFTYGETSASETWIKKDRDIHVIKPDLKTLVATQRYNKETSGIKVTVQNTEVTIDTSRDGRNIFVQKYMMMNDADTVSWKFPECWLTLTKNDLGQIVTAGGNHIQQQFDWEQSLLNLIDDVETIEELKTIFNTIHS